MRFIYNIGIYIFTGIVRIVSPFNRKASLLAKGNKKWDDALKSKIDPGEKYIWMHCASLGEFEQGRPLIETIKRDKPQYKILLTFFSPSGYEIRKDYRQADIICYLPYDTPLNARNFITLINPAIVIFIKYEFWNNYICELGRKGIALYLVSGIFRKGQHFFKWYGSFFRNMLKKFKWIYVQDQLSLELLKGIGQNNCSIAGDTRFDRVLQIAGDVKDIPQLEKFRGNDKLFLAGSSWKKDEEIIARYINSFPDRMKWVFAPHEINNENIGRLEGLLSVKSIRFSEFIDGKADAKVMIIDNVGMLSSAYRYAFAAAVGGGFGKGIHNILEPACWGVPVLFGPNYHKFREAVELITLDGARAFEDYDEFEKILDSWLSDDTAYRKSAGSAREYVKKNTGATDKIVGEIL